MLFNSFEFIFLFLPLCLVGFFTIAKKQGNEAAILFLVIASLFFYGWWNPAYLLLLIGSMIFNYQLGKKLGNTKSKSLLSIGVIINLGAIGYFKYAGFIVFNLNTLLETQWSLGQIILPLAISFFTFQQIAYLVDSYRGITKEYSFVHYSLFVSFFPQLIAGPIVHHKDMLPQFAKQESYRFNANHMTIGLTIFAIGLFKKTVLADGVAIYATPVFESADNGDAIDFFTAWGGALAYTFQLYFDFSGYSDMAIGLARMFGIILPLNFYSPYKAANISEFWRRWHMTLSQFLRDYVYISLGGNRKGNTKRYSNLMFTMLLGGLWHGAGWNFIIWGGLHGAYLVINHSWQAIINKTKVNFIQGKLYNFVAWSLTFIAVVIGWVFFRAVTLDGALNILSGMIGLNGISVPNAILARLGELGGIIQSWGIEPSTGGAVFLKTWLWNILLLIAVVLLPSIQDLFHHQNGTLNALYYSKKQCFWPFYKYIQDIRWQETNKWALLAGVSLTLGILTLSQVSEFLYFQF
ncbi:MBOAT family O-acyltransferase [Thalassotalea ganghwensis]